MPDGPLDNKLPMGLSYPEPIDLPGNIDWAIEPRFPGSPIENASPNGVRFGGCTKNGEYGCWKDR